MFPFQWSGKSKPVRQAATAVIESLESRQLLSGSVSLSASGVLSVTGSRKADKISITVDRRHATNLDVSVNGRTTVVKAARVAVVHVDAGAGNDTITEAANITAPSTLLGGEGNDTITAGGGSDDVMDGGNGVDQCDFHGNSGVPLTGVPALVQAGLTTLAQGATITAVQQFNEDGLTYFGSLVTINGVNTRIVVDANGNPVTTGIDDNHGGRDHHDGLFGQLTAVDTTANTITVTLRSEHGADQVKTLNVTPSTTIMSDGAATTLGALPLNSWVHLKLSTTDATAVTSVQAFGKRVEGTLVSADTGASTITVTDHETNAQTTYNVSNTATITVNGASSTLGGLTMGMELRLKFSADNATVVAIFSGDSHGDHGGGGDGQGGSGGGHHDHEGPDF